MSALYTSYKNRMLAELLSGTVKAALMPASASQNMAHDFYDDISASVVATATLSGKSVTAGVFDATDVVFPNVPAGAAVDAVVLYIDTGDPATSPLIGWMDGVSLTPNGANITATFPNDANKIIAT